LNSGRSLAALCVGLTLFLAACSRRQPQIEPSAPPALEIGLYRATLNSEGEKQRRFRLLLFAELPDRLHGEALTPTSSTVLIVDAGDRRMAISLVRDQVAYVGPAEADSLSRILGVRVELDELVATLLGAGDPPAGHRIERQPEGQTGLPQRFTVTGPEGSLELELKKRRPFRGDPNTLGKGEPPEGFELRPLAEFGAVDLPVEATEGGVAR